MPVSRPRMVGIQSQPTDAWKVGLSAPRAPPFLSVFRTVASLMLPGVAVLRMRTARAFLRPESSFAVTSKRPRVKAPSMRPSFSPLRKTSAFQLMPSKLSQIFLPEKADGVENSLRYQKSAWKKLSETINWLSEKLGSGMAPALRRSEEHTSELQSRPYL